MRFLRLQALCNFTTLLPINRVLAFVTSSISCLIILVWVGIIVIVNILNPHKSILQMMLLYGSASVGAGFLVTSASVWIANIAERMALEELRQIEEEVKKQYLQPYACNGCKHFYGVIYNRVPLICGMHPYGVDTEHCPDWEKK